MARCPRARVWQQTKNFRSNIGYSRTKFGLRRICAEDHGPMDPEQERLEHQIELATRAASYIRDESTVQRLLRFAEQLKHKLLLSSRRRKIRTRAYRLWEQAGCPSGRDWDFWFEAERQIRDQNE
ncbi:DUF2934 domain-containing protein [Bradyrhizobium sp. UFLA05-153]